MMVLYHSVGAVGLTDPQIRGAGAHHNATALVAMLADLLNAGREAGVVDRDLDAVAEARLFTAAITGLSAAVLLDAMSADEAIDAHLRRLGPRRRR